MRVPIILAALLLATAPAAAQPTAAQQQARQFTDAGMAAQKAGEYETAIKLYAKAYALIPHPLLLFNMAQANRLDDRKQMALDLYRRYLAADPDGPNAAVARQWVIELEAELRARAAEEQRREEAARAEAAQRASEERRKAELARTAEATRQIEAARLAAEEDRRARAAAPRLGLRPRSGSIGTDEPPAGTDEPPARTDEPPARTDEPPARTDEPPARTDDPERRAQRGVEGRATQRRVALGAAGAGAAVIGVGLYFGVRARSDWADAHADDCDANHQCSERGLQRIDDAQGHARIATGATLVGVAALATGAALYWRAREPHRSATALRAAPSMSPTSAGLVLTGGF